MVIVHSDRALEVAQQQLPHHHISKVLHPVTSTDAAHGNASDAAPLVLVAGQYKPERDLQLLARLGPELTRLGYDTRISGRGWPDVPGWTVDSRFLTETELEAELSAASVLLMPYRNYFQSGVALRALECGTLTVGRRSTFLTDLYGGRSDLLVDDDRIDSYLRAIGTGIERAGAGQLLVAYRRAVDISWQSFLATDGASLISE